MTGFLEKKKTSLSAGLFWASAAVFFGKICALLSQVIGGFFLSASDYGMIAFTTSIIAFLAIFYNYGLDNYLIQQHKNWQTILPTIWKVALTTTIFGMVSGAVSAVFFMLRDDNSSLFWMIITGIAYFPFASFFPLYKAEHAVEGNYIYQSFITAVNSIINMMSFIFFLFLGFGSVSFFLGLLLGNASSYILFRRGAQKINNLKSGTFRYDTFKKTFRDLWAVALGNIFNSLSLRIDYLILGIIATHSALGYYFFGFSLTGALALLFTAGIQGILMPDLVHKLSSRERFRKSLALIEFSSIYIGGLFVACFLFALPDFLYIVWGTRWDKACFVALVLSTVLPSVVCRASLVVALDASGQWTKKAAINGINFICVVIFTWVGWRLDGLIGVTISVSIQRILFSLLVVSYINKVLLDISVLKTVINIVRYSIPLIIISILGWISGYVEFMDFSGQRGFFHLLSNVPVIAVFFAGYIITGYIVAPNYMKMLYLKASGIITNRPHL